MKIKGLVMEVMDMDVDRRPPAAKFRVIGVERWMMSTTSTTSVVPTSEAMRLLVRRSLPESL